MVLNTSVSI